MIFQVSSLHPSSNMLPIKLTKLTLIHLPTEYTDMSMSVVTQRQSVAFNGSVIGLKALLERVGGVGTVAEIEPELKYKVFDSVTIIINGKVLIMEWEATPITDMYADTVLASLMQTELVGNTIVKKADPDDKTDRKHFEDCLLETLTDMFGIKSIPKAIFGDIVAVKVDDKLAEINLDSLVCDLFLSIRCFLMWKKIFFSQIFN